MSTFSERLALAMQGPPTVNQASLARGVRVSGATVSHWLSGEIQTLKGANLLRVAEFLSVRPEWLQSGEGSMRTHDANPSRYRISEPTDSEPAMPITFRDAFGSCGGGSVTEADLRQPLLKEPAWFRRYQVSPRTALAVWADGDSMSDFIVDGDIVIFDTSKTAPKSGSIFLIEHPDGLRIKRLRREIDGTWVLESNNPDKRRFPDERITPDQLDLLRIMGQFVYRQGG